MTTHIIVNSPLEAIKDVYDKAISNGTKLRGNNSEIPSHFRKLFNTRQQIEKIPSINSQDPLSLPNKSLVRFRCMIQDTSFAHEVYVSSFHGKCTLYTDDLGSSFEIQEDIQMTHENLDSRQALYCVSIPGETTNEVDSLARLSIETTNDGNLIEKRYPFRGEYHTAAIVKIYDFDEDKFRVTDTIEVVGVLEHPLKNTHEDESNQPLVPSIHSIFYDKIDFHETGEIDSINRQETINYISSALGGDKLAAEFVLLQLLSKIIARRSGVLLGKMSLNLSGLPIENSPVSKEKSLKHQNPIAKKLSTVLSNLLPRFHDLPLSLDVLNEIPFFPRSDSWLESGILQVPAGTTLLVDETAMQEGTLKDLGVRNIQVLNEVMTTQKLNYVFPFNNFEFDTDIGFIILSNAKSFLQVDIEVPLKLSELLSPVIPYTGNVEILKKYVTFGRSYTCKIPNEMSKHIQDQFVNERKSASGGISSSSKTTVPNQDDLARRITLARLVAASFGKKQLDMESWDHAVQIDQERLNRFAEHSQTKST